MGEPVVKVFLSYSHDSREHAERVLALANQLRHDGIDAELDQYEDSPPEGWPHWMERQIDGANFVLVICTETYLRRSKGQEQVGRGLGVRWESLLTYNELYEAGSRNDKYIPICFDDDIAAHIPKPLQGSTRYVLAHPDGYGALLRRLYAESAAVRPSLGPRPHLTPRAVNPAFFKPKRNNFVEVCLARSTRFVGREKDLRRLHEKLNEGQGALALSGEGGVGKTQLAIEYAHRYSDAYEGMWWVDASRESLSASIAKLAALLGAETEALHPEEIRTELCRRLSQGRQLLILDNVERLEDFTAFTVQAPSQVLVTTRLSRLPQGRVTTLQVNVLERGASLMMLRSARPELPSEEDTAVLDEISEHLGDHPLALDFAAEYLRKYPDVSLREMMDALHRAEVGEVLSPLEDTEPEEIGLGYRLKVAKSLGLHLPEFEGTPGEVLLALVSFCHPAEIPLELLFASASPFTKEEVRRWLRKLADVSILGYAQSIHLHRLTQSVIRSRLSKQKARVVLSRLVAATGQDFGNPEDHRDWPKQDRLAPHALAMLDAVRRMGIAEPLGMGNTLSHYLNIRGRYAQALWALNVLQPDGQLIKPSDVKFFSRSACVGNILFAQSRFDEALDFYDRAEFLLHGAEGVDLNSLALIATNKGDIFRSRDNLASSLKYYREAERILHELNAPDVLPLGTVLLRIGQVLEAQEKIDEALEQFKKSETLLRGSFDGGHPTLAVTLMCIGDWWAEYRTSDNARPYYREATQMALKALGPTHSLSLNCGISWAELVREPSELVDAQRCLRILEAGIQNEGKKDSPALLRIVELLAQICTMQGDGDEALTRYRQAQEIARKALGDGHPNVAVIRANIGQLLAAKGEVAEALVLLNQSIPFLLAESGVDHPVACGMADVLRTLGGNPLEIARRVLGESAAVRLKELLGPTNREE